MGRSNNVGFVGPDPFAEYSRERDHGFMAKRAELLFVERLRPLTGNGLTAEVCVGMFADHYGATRCSRGAGTVCPRTGVPEGSPTKDP